MGTRTALLPLPRLALPLCGLPLLASCTPLASVSSRLLFCISYLLISRLASCLHFASLVTWFASRLKPAHSPLLMFTLELAALALVVSRRERQEFKVPGSIVRHEPLFKMQATAMMAEGTRYIGQRNHEYTKGVATPRHRGTVMKDRSQRRGGCEMCKRCIGQPARI